MPVHKGLHLSRVHGAPLPPVPSYGRCRGAKDELTDAISMGRLGQDGRPSGVHGKEFHLVLGQQARERGIPRRDESGHVEHHGGGLHVRETQVARVCPPEKQALHGGGMCHCGSECGGAQGLHRVIAGAFSCLPSSFSKCAPSGSRSSGRMSAATTNHPRRRAVATTSLSTGNGMFKCTFYPPRYACITHLPRNPLPPTTTAHGRCMVLLAWSSSNSAQVLGPSTHKHSCWNRNLCEGQYVFVGCLDNGIKCTMCLPQLHCTAHHQTNWSPDTTVGA